MQKQRLDSWSLVIPKVNQIIQIGLEGITFDTTVRTRSTRDNETYFITVDSPFPEENTMELFITPNASGRGRIDGFSGAKPYWQVASSHGAKVDAKLFMLD